MTSRRSVISLAIAGAAVLLAGLVWYLSFRTGLGNRADIGLLRRVAKLQLTDAQPPMSFVATLCNTGPYALLCLLVLAAAVVTRGLGGGIVIGAVLVGTNAVTQVLKEATAVDRVHAPYTTLVHVEPVSWPSGHATAAAVLMLCVVAVTPPAWRKLTSVLGAAYAAAVGLSVVGLGWHFASDVIGGYCIAAAGAALGFAFLPAWLPERFAGAVGRSRQDEQQVAQPV